MGVCVCACLGWTTEPLRMWIRDVCMAFPCSWVYEHICGLCFCESDAICPKMIQWQIFKPQTYYPNTNYGLCWLKLQWTEKSRGNGPSHITCLELHTVSSALTGAVNNQQNHSQRLSSEITAMTVCLTSTVTSSLLLLLFFFLNSSLVIKVGKLNTPNALCFHLVVTVTQKHWAVMNGILLCHQSLADKDRIVVFFEKRRGNVLAEVEAGGLVRSGLAGPELRPGCLHCSPDPGTDSGSVQRERQTDRSPEGRKKCWHEINGIM